jgi:AbrB family looped-hinge helix DNA binding protein
MADMAVISVRVEKSGRVLIPAAIRRRLGLKEGESELLWDIDETPIAVTTRAQALKRIQQWASHFIEPGRLVSDELTAERHRQAEEELGE